MFLPGLFKVKKRSYTSLTLTLSLLKEGEGIR